MNSQRLYQGDDGQWYFNVRGNQARGPYSTHQDADSALRDHVSQCRRRLSASLWPEHWVPFRQRVAASKPHQTT